jgi:hypothetical protein
MHELHQQIREEQRRASVRVISPPHALGFLDETLPKRAQRSAATIPAPET